MIPLAIVSTSCRTVPKWFLHQANRVVGRVQSGAKALKKCPSKHGNRTTVVKSSLQSILPRRVHKFSWPTKKNTTAEFWLSTMHSYQPPEVVENPGSLTTHRIDPQTPGLPHKLPCRSVQVVESRSWIFKHVLTLWQLMLRLVNSKILTSDPNNSYGTKTIRAPRKKKPCKNGNHQLLFFPNIHPDFNPSAGGTHCAPKNPAVQMFQGKHSKKAASRNRTNGGFKWHAAEKHP